MKVLSKFKLGESVGYMIEEAEGMSYGVTLRGLYDENILQGLTESGYKVMDYHGNIITPDGISIADLIEEDCAANEAEIQMMMDMEEYVLSEEEATKYFCRDVDIPEIEFRQPKVEISTREELIEYLNRWESLNRVPTTVPDIRPLNSFVAKEALFTLDEYVKDDSVKRLFRIIESRRCMRSLADYKRLVQYLQNEGVLGAEFNADELKEAYLSWGICGLKTAVTEKKVELGVAASIYDLSESLAAVTKSAGRVQSLGLMDRDGTIFTTAGSINLKNSECFSEEKIYPLVENSYWDLLRTTEKWTTEYMPIEVFIPEKFNRTYMRLLEDGITFRAKFDISRMVIMDLRHTVLAQSFLTIKCADSSEISIEFAMQDDTFLRFNLARAKARDLIAVRTVPVPVDNSYDLYINEGVTPENAVNYIAKRMLTEPPVNLQLDDGINYADAAELYRTGPDKQLIKKYNPNDMDYSNIDELIDIMLNTREEMIADNTYLQISKDALGAYAAQVKEEIQTRPLEKLEFVKLTRQGEVAVGQLGQGQRDDGHVAVDSIAMVLLVACDLANNNIPMDFAKFCSVMQDIESRGIFDVNVLIKERNNAYRGYLRDRARLNADRATQCARAVYITKVYREAANTDVADQRHYAFECVSLDIQDKKRSPIVAAQNTIANAIITSSIECGLGYFQKDVIRIEAPSLALKLMFAMAFKRVKVINEGTTVVIEENVMVGVDDYVTLKIRIPSEVYNLVVNPNIYRINQICTLTDWCELEMTRQAWNLYCLNANITPWHVQPKDGVTIPVYSFGINYIYQDTVKGFSAEFQTRVANEKSKVNEFAKFGVSNALLKSDVTDIVMEYTERTIDAVLDPNNDETIDNYYTRFMMHNKAARERGEYLKHMRLRSDVVYANWADEWAEQVNIDKDADVYAELVDVACATKWITATKPEILTSDAKARSLSTNNDLESFKILEKTYEDYCSWLPVVRGEVKPSTINVVVGSSLMCIMPDKSRVIYNLYEMNLSQANKLAQGGVFYQLGARDFLIITVAGKFHLKIKQ